jgi:Domain of unknown function (DUF4398)
MPMTFELPARLHPVLAPAVLPIGLALVCAALMAGCAAPASRPPSLMEAYIAVDAARSDRKVRALAPAGLHEAETALAQAFRAWQAGQPVHEVNQLAHLARQRASIVRSQAIERRGRNKIEILRAQAERPHGPPDAGTTPAEAAMLPPNADPLLPAAGEPPAPRAPCVERGRCAGASRPVDWPCLRSLARLPDGSNP